MKTIYNINHFTLFTWWALMAAGPYTLKFCASEWAKGHVNKIWTVYVWCKYGKFWGSTTNITWNYGEDWPLIDIASDLWLLCWSPVVSHYPITNHTLRIHNPTLLFSITLSLLKILYPTIVIPVPLFLYQSHYFCINLQSHNYYPTILFQSHSFGHPTPHSSCKDPTFGVN